MMGGNANPPMAVAVAVPIPITNGVPITNGMSTSCAVPSAPPAAFAGAASAPATTTTITTTSYTIPPPSASTSYTVPPPHASTPAPAPSMMIGGLGRYSAAIQCPFCRAQTVTRTRNRIDGLTMIAVVVMCFLFWPLFWLPLCMPSCKSTKHYCMHCNQKIAKTDPCSEIIEFFRC